MRHKPLIVWVLCASVLAFGFAAGARAQLRLEAPVRCPSTVSCTIQKYVDTDPGPGYRDYTCGDLSSPDHEGTDIRVPTLADMALGVPVTAAASGTVTAVRDGMDDINVKDIDPALIEKRGGGNLVVLDHGNGWRTIYAHLRKGSVRVNKGDRVAAGQTLGEIGMSGRAEFPHVEFMVKRGRRVIDPFLGLDPMAPCGETGTPLWSEAALAELGYVATGLLSAGFAPERANAKRARAGRYFVDTLPADSPALVFWVDLFGVKKGDRARSRLLDANGAVLADGTTELEKRFAQWFRFVGKRRPADGWPPGTYRGEFSLTRAGAPAPVVSIVREIELR